MKLILDQPLTTLQDKSAAIALICIATALSGRTGAGVVATSLYLLCIEG